MTEQTLSAHRCDITKDGIQNQLVDIAKHVLQTAYLGTSARQYTRHKTALYALDNPIDYTEADYTDRIRSKIREDHNNLLYTAYLKRQFEQTAKALGVGTESERKSAWDVFERSGYYRHFKDGRRESPDTLARSVQFNPLENLVRPSIAFDFDFDSADTNSKTFKLTEKQMRYVLKKKDNMEYLGTTLYTLLGSDTAKVVATTPEGDLVKSYEQAEQDQVIIQEAVKKLSDSGRALDTYRFGKSLTSRLIAGFLLGDHDAIGFSEPRTELDRLTYGFSSGHNLMMNADGSLKAVDQA